MRSQLWLVCLLARATSLQPPLSAAWVEEWKSGLVQHRPWDRRASSAYALLAANAEAPVARDRWRDGFALRATAADALRSVSAPVDGVAAVDTSAEELAVSVPLAGGVGLRLVAADRRALARGAGGGILRVVLDGADLGVAPRAASGEALLDVDAAPSTSTRRPRRRRGAPTTPRAGPASMRGCQARARPDGAPDGLRPWLRVVGAVPREREASGAAADLRRPFPADA